MTRVSCLLFALTFGWPAAANDSRQQDACATLAAIMQTTIRMTMTDRPGLRTHLKSDPSLFEVALTMLTEGTGKQVEAKVKAEGLGVPEYFLSKCGGEMGIAELPKDLDFCEVLRLSEQTRKRYESLKGQVAPGTTDLSKIVELRAAHFEFELAYLAGQQASMRLRAAGKDSPPKCQ